MVHALPKIQHKGAFVPVIQFGYLHHIRQKHATTRPNSVELPDNREAGTIKVIEAESVEPVEPKKAPEQGILMTESQRPPGKQPKPSIHNSINE